jgi:hypothetical protein
MDIKKSLVADVANVIEVGGAAPPAITSANVLTQLALVYDAIPAAVLANQENLRIYVSSPVAAAYRSAVAASNTQANLTQASRLYLSWNKNGTLSRNAWFIYNRSYFKR